MSDVPISEQALRELETEVLDHHAFLECVTCGGTGNDLREDNGNCRACGGDGNGPSGIALAFLAIVKELLAWRKIARDSIDECGRCRRIDGLYTAGWTCRQCERIEKMLTVGQEEE